MYGRSILWLVILLLTSMVFYSCDKNPVIESATNSIKIEASVDPAKAAINSEVWINILVISKYEIEEVEFIDETGASTTTPTPYILSKQVQQIYGRGGYRYGLAWRFSVIKETPGLYTFIIKSRNKIGDSAEETLSVTYVDSDVSSSGMVRWVPGGGNIFYRMATQKERPRPLQKPVTPNSGGGVGIESLGCNSLSSCSISH